MEKKYTMNPIPSVDPCDGKMNMIGFDEFSNSDKRTYLDRFKREHLTISGILADQEDRFAKALQNVGYERIGDYEAGLEVKEYNQIFRRESPEGQWEWYMPSPDLELPYTLTGDWETESDSFVSVGDAALRSELAGEGGAGLVGFDGGRTLADLNNPSEGDSMIAVSQPFPNAIIRNQHQKNLDHVTTSDFDVPQSPVDSTSFFSEFESNSDIKTVDLLGGSYSVSGITLSKVYYNGDLMADGDAVVKNINPLSRVMGNPRVGAVPLPSRFVNRLLAEVFFDGNRFVCSDIFHSADWFRTGFVGDDIYVSYANGDDSSGDGTLNLPYKTMTKAFAETSSRAIVINVLDDFIPRQGSGVTGGNITISNNVKIVSKSPSGRSTIGGWNDTGMNSWELESGSSYKAVMPLVTAVFDSKFRSQKGDPRPLMKADSRDQAVSNEGFWFFTEGSNELIVNLFDGREPDRECLVMQSVGGWIFDIPTNGRIIAENITFLSTSEAADSVRVTPRFTSENTALAAFKNCNFVGGMYNGLSITRVKTTVTDNCVAAYCGRDGFSYHDEPMPSTMVAYEVGNTAYECGVRGVFASNTNTNSDNCSTAHEGMNILRVDCSYINAKDAVVADVNGCVSVNLGVSSGESKRADSQAKASFLFNDDGATTEGIAYLIGCSSAWGETYSISTGDQSVQVRVKDWRGELSVYPGTVIRNINGNRIN